MRRIRRPPGPDRQRVWAGCVHCHPRPPPVSNVTPAGLRKNPATVPGRPWGQEDGRRESPPWKPRAEIPVAGAIRQGNLQAKGTCDLPGKAMDRSSRNRIAGAKHSPPPLLSRAGRCAPFARGPRDHPAWDRRDSHLPAAVALCEGNTKCPRSLRGCSAGSLPRCGPEFR